MKRRDFSLQLAGAGLGLAASGLALAQVAPVEGQQYKKLSKPRAPSFPAPTKKVEVIEFFWYGCGHCFAFEPALEAWAAQLPADVVLRRVPWAMLSSGGQQKVFYALDDMGLLPSLHRKIFNAIHVDKKVLNDESDIAAYLETQGVDRRKLTEALQSFSVAKKVGECRQLAEQFELRQVPSMVVQGRFLTSPEQAGTADRMLTVVNHLLQTARQAT